MAFACKTAPLGPELIVSIGPRLPMFFVNSKQGALASRMTQVLRVPASSVFCAFKTAISIRITSLYGSQPSFVAFACKTAPLGPELRVSMGPRPHMVFAFKTETLAPE